MSDFVLFGGGGFVGSCFYNTMLDLGIQKIPRNSIKFEGCKRVAYFISTTDNYNVFDNPFIDIETNLTHLIRVLNENKDRIEEINFISSWFVYGDCADTPAKESSVCNPKGFYSITKKCAEDLLISFCNTFGIKYRILRLANVIGPNDRNVSKKKNALQYLIGELKAGRDIQLYDNGNFIRDYIHVEDACVAIKKCILNSPHNTIVNVGNGVPVKFSTLIDKATSILNYKGAIKSMDATPFHKLVQVKNMFLDTTLLRKYTNYCPQYDILDYVETLCATQ